MFKQLKIKELCRPAKFYLYLSLLGLVLSLIQNKDNFSRSRYCCGTFSTNVPSVMLIFVFKIIYVAFWVYIINLICKDGKKTFAWLLVLFPFILLFVILGILMLTGSREGLENKEKDGDEKEQGQESDVKNNYDGFDTSAGLLPN